MVELEQFYRDLLAKDHQSSPLQSLALLSLLNIVKPALSSHDIEILERVPMKSNLCKTLRLMARGKSLGIDNSLLRFLPVAGTSLNKISSTFSYTFGKLVDYSQTSMKGSSN